jgi:hypothetical protein
MVRIKKNYNNISKKIFRQNTKKSIKSVGGENTNLSQRICKGRTKEDCIDGTGNCQYIDGAKRKYCKRVSKCKKGCQAPCAKIMYNNKSYCLPPDKNGNPQTIEDVKDILSELIVDDTTEKNQNDVSKENIINQPISDNTNDLTQNELEQNTPMKENINRNPKHSSNQNNETETKIEKKNEEIHNEEKGSVVAILYGKSSYDTTTGSCSIL